MSLHNPISPLHAYYVQKVLPAVYDDSLSYYEILCKVQETLNEVVSTTNEQSVVVLEMQQAINDFINGGYTDTFEEYLDEWFDENSDAFVQRLIDEGIIPEIASIQNDLETVHGNIAELVAADTSIRNDMVAADTSIRNDMVAADTSIRNDMNSTDTELATKKVPYPLVGATPSYGTSGQVLSTNADGTTAWQNPVVPSDAQAEQFITQWLNDHPEATTTVQDNSLNGATKLIDGSVPDSKLSPTGLRLDVSELQESLDSKVDVSEFQEVLDSKVDIGITNYDLSDMTLANGRIVAATGEAAGNNTFKHIELDISAGQSVTFTTDTSGMGSNFGYCFVDSSNNVLLYASDSNLRNQTLTVYAPENAVKFLNGWAATSVLSEPCKNIVVKNYDDTFVGTNRALSDTITELELVKDSAWLALPDRLGVADNLLRDIWEFGTKRFDIIREESAMYKVERLVDDGILYGFQAKYDANISCSMVRIKKTGQPRTFLYQRTVESLTFDEHVTEGDYLYQSNNPHNFPIPMGQVIESNNEYITIITYGAQDANDKWKGIILASYSSYTSPTVNTPSAMEIDIDHSAVFDTSITYSDIVFGKRYYSRSEKLNSTLRGKCAVVFSDSLSGIIDYIVQDWGLTCYTIASGGCRMGYESGSGAGGESGSMEDMWLCNNSRITLFKNNAPLEVDFIINLTGTNGTLPPYDSTELKFVLNNKRWFDSASTTDTWSSLSDSDKARFTSSACYVAAFISLLQLYPTARLAMGGIYVCPSAASGMGVSTWDSYDDTVNAIYHATSLSKEAKNARLLEMATQLGAAFVDAGVQSGVSILNTPYYAPGGVHPIKTIQEAYAAQLCKQLCVPLDTTLL